LVGVIRAFMALLTILEYPDPRLRKVAAPVAAVTPEIRKLVSDMAETMYAAPGVGLAAPQVGVGLRIAVVDVSERDENGALLVLINPEITYTEGEVEDEEGCLSIKDFNAAVTRFAKVRIKAADRDGNVRELEGEGLLARAFQHELDHLNGLLFIDRISPLKRDLLKRRVKKAIKKEGVAAS
jgi:peptide deformylase